MYLAQIISLHWTYFYDLPPMNGQIFSCEISRDNVINYFISQITTASLERSRFKGVTQFCLCFYQLYIETYLNHHSLKLLLYCKELKTVKKKKSNPKSYINCSSEESCFVN